MSQIKFQTKLNNKNIEIVAGWDKPLQSYHLTVFDLDDDEEDVLYDIWNTHGFVKSTKEIREYIVGNNISIPEDFFSLIEEKLGNVSYVWKNNRWISFNI
jgi:hypothetical protein